MQEAHPPTAEDITIEVSPGETVQIPYAGSDVDGDLVGFIPTSGVTPAGAGTVTCLCDCIGRIGQPPVCTCTCSFQASATFEGVASFTYRAVDSTGLQSADATVTILVRPPHCEFNVFIQTTYPFSFVDSTSAHVGDVTALSRAEGFCAGTRASAITETRRDCSAVIFPGSFCTESLRVSDYVPATARRDIEHRFAAQAATTRLVITHTVDSIPAEADFTASYGASGFVATQVERAIAAEAGEVLQLDVNGTRVAEEERRLSARAGISLLRIGPPGGPFAVTPFHTPNKHEPAGYPPGTVPALSTSSYTVRWDTNVSCESRAPLVGGYLPTENVVYAIGQADVLQAIDITGVDSHGCTVHVVVHGGNVADIDRTVGGVAAPRRTLHGLDNKAVTIPGGFTWVP